jgi:hypothetical protein
LYVKAPTSAPEPRRSGGSPIRCAAISRDGGGKTSWPARPGRLFELAGVPAAAVQHYRAAAEHTRSIPERNYLIEKAARLGRRQA